LLAVAKADQRHALFSNVGTKNRAMFLVPNVSEYEVGDSISQFSLITFRGLHQPAHLPGTQRTFQPCPTLARSGLRKERD
jgi:hypothetical protein